MNENYEYCVQCGNGIDLIEEDYWIEDDHYLCCDDCHSEYLQENEDEN